jgi:hypothetical protein
MTADDIWDLAAINASLKTGIQADKAMHVGIGAILRIQDAKAPATNEGGEFQPAEAAQGVSEDAVMEDPVPVSDISIFESGYPRYYI